MSNTVITVRNISKRYMIGHQRQAANTGFRDVLSELPTKLWRRLRNPHYLGNDGEEIFWALKDIDFEVDEGTCLGIIGRNGAGKSTLLKVLSRITEPTTGRVTIRGRVASLLEVGTGFHPELTGRENIFLNGSILGMSRREVSRKFDEIIDFAGVERFLDTPVKRYSSGMYVRLAFAIAAHLEPEILIVDEVLAVGDARFQKKCLGKMESVGKEGKTVLFVSHNMAAVKTLCNRGMLLENGQMAFMGAAEEAVEQYLGASILDRKEIVWSGAEAPGNRYIGVESIAVRPLHGAVIDIESGIEFSVGFVNKEAGKKISCALRLYTLDGICLFATGVFLSSDDEGDAEPGRYSARCVFPPNLLNVGAYKIHLMFVQNRRELLFGLEEAIAFEVEHTVKTVGGHMTPAQGLIRPKLDWTWQVSQEGS